MKIKTVFVNGDGEQFDTHEGCLNSYRDNLIESAGRHIVDKMGLPFSFNKVKVAEIIIDNLKYINRKPYLEALAELGEYDKDAQFDWNKKH